MHFVFVFICRAYAAGNVGCCVYSLTLCEYVANQTLAPARIVLELDMVLPTGRTK